MSESPQVVTMDPPPRQNLPLFVYGVLKPGLPAFEALRQWVSLSEPDSVDGELLVRDGLPLLLQNSHGEVKGYRLHWHDGQEGEAYAVVCAFEPRKHYEWKEVVLLSGQPANALVIRYPRKGNPQHLGTSSWHLSDDPAFGPGLEAVEGVLKEVDEIPDNNPEANWQRFFRSQMGYLLLWSILERLTALCLGPSLEPMQRIKRLHQLNGIAEAVKAHVTRSDEVADSRDPNQNYRLNADNAKKSFEYYYQVRSNLSHRGKGVYNEFAKVHGSLRELLGITRQFLEGLEDRSETGGTPRPEGGDDVGLAHRDDKAEMSQPLRESGIVRAVAENAARRIARRVIADLQRMGATLSGPDTGLETAWDEFCAQVQSEPSVTWRAYDETVRALVAAHLADLPRHEKEALWLQTDAGDEWVCEDERDREPDPVCDREVIDYVTGDTVYAEAARWSNPRIRGYLDRPRE